jgi:hypothetical protein
MNRNVVGYESLNGIHSRVMRDVGSCSDTLYKLTSYHRENFLFYFSFLVYPLNHGEYVVIYSQQLGNWCQHNQRVSLFAPLTQQSAFSDVLRLIQ